MSVSKIAGAFAALLMATTVAGAANATTYDLTVNGSAIGGLSSYGTVDVTRNADGRGLDFTVTLAPDVFFHDGGAHTSFAFDLAGGTPDVTFSAISGFGSGYTFGGPGTFANSPFGNFEYGLDCDCGQGNDPDVPGPLKFTITPTDGVTVLNLDGHGSDPVIFAAADLRNANPQGSTGAVGAVLSFTPGVPEPATWSMLILGMGMVGGVLRMRRRVGQTGVSI
ncbi:MAG TPA: PEPxxWA-CTERM sorting domain-containing protein [Caulobacteraceae bacterium]|nr:PEPxxWA-CTERM sorting domain-containing protein [Caulobacteraceae bacterium]